MTEYKSVAETAKMLGVANATIKRWEREGKLVAFHTPYGRMFSVAEIERYKKTLLIPENARKIEWQRGILQTK